MLEVLLFLFWGFYVISSMAIIFAVIYWETKKNGKFTKKSVVHKRQNSYLSVYPYTEERNKSYQTVFFER